MQQLEKRLRERTDQGETGVPPVRGKWNTVNNPYEERYQSKLEGIQKERRAAIEVSQELLAIFGICSKDYNHQKQHTMGMLFTYYGYVVVRSSNEPIKKSSLACSHSLQ